MIRKSFLTRLGMSLSYIVWVAFALVGVGMIGIPALMIFLAPTDLNAWLSGSPVGAMIFSTLIYVIAIVIILLPMVIRRKSLAEIKQAIGLGKPFQASMIPWALVMQGLYIALAMAVLLALYVANIPGLDMGQQQNLGLSDLTGWYEYVAVFVLLVLVAPIFEEIIFRGYLYGKLRRYSSMVIATLITSAGFGVVHGQVNVAIIVGLLSIMMCIVREKFDSIYPTILMHMFQNGFSYLMIFILPLYFSF